MPLLFIVLICSIAHNAQARLHDEGIVGGVETEPHELKYQIVMEFFGIEWCGGSIIDEQFAITAAHCVVDENDRFVTEIPFKIVAGTSDLNDINDQDKVEVEIEKVYIPSIYSKKRKTHVGDIAVLKLKSKLDLGPNSNLAKLHLPASTENKLTTENSADGAEALVSGFGWNVITLDRVTSADNKTTYEEDGSSNRKLLKATALVVANSKCQSSYKSYTIYDSHICAKLIQHPADVPQGVCSGDSGSPLALDGTVIGVVSFNYLGCNDSKRPAVYTRISAYIGFIDKAKRDFITPDMRAQVWI